MSDLSKLTKGQVLWLRLRFENGGNFSDIKHPYLVIDVDNGIEVVEVLQLDSLKGREYYLFEKGNIEVKAEDETVLKEDSYIQLGKIIKLQHFNGLENFRETTDLLSRSKLTQILWRREEFIRFNDIEDKNNLFFTREEILEHNPIV